MIRPPLLIRFLLYCSLFLMLVWPSTTPRGKHQRGKARVRRQLKRTTARKRCLTLLITGAN